MTSSLPLGYKAVMEKVDAYLELTVSLDEGSLIEVRELSTMLGAMADRYQSFVVENYPDHENDARFYIQEIRRGSIILEFVPLAVGMMDQISIVHNFWNLTSSTLKAYVAGNLEQVRGPENDRSIAAIVKPIAESSNGNLSLAVRERQTNDVHERIILIDAGDARKAFAHTGLWETQAPLQLVEDRTETKRHNRVTMYFEQTNRKRDTSGKKTGEKVLVPQLLDKERPLIYQSDDAERQIKKEMLDDPDNIYHKVFLVDLFADYRKGKVALYRLINIHDVTDVDPDSIPDLVS